MTRPKNATSARKALSLQRQKASLELRRLGNSYAEIGRQVGISTSRAHALVTQALIEVRDSIREDVIELRALELSRLDGMLGGLWPDARKGQVGAVDRVLKIMERRARLLGLDAPAKIARTNAAGEEPGDDGARYIVPVPPTMDLQEWLGQLGTA
ncbi:MAG: hypothetical protein WCY29_15830 [Novosphingobium sp.]